MYSLIVRNTGITTGTYGARDVQRARRMILQHHRER